MKFSSFLALVALLSPMLHGMNNDGKRVIIVLPASDHQQSIAVQNQGNNEIIEVLTDNPDLEKGVDHQSSSIPMKLKKLNLDKIDPDLLYEECATQHLILVHGSHHKKLDYIKSRFTNKLKEAHQNGHPKHQKAIDKLIVHTSQRSARIKQEILQKSVSAYESTEPSKNASALVTSSNVVAAPTVQTVSASTSTAAPAVKTIPASNTNVSPQAASNVPASTSVPTAQSVGVASNSSTSASNASAQPNSGLQVAEEIGQIILENIPTIGELLAESLEEYNALKTKGLIGTGGAAGVLGTLATVFIAIYGSKH